MGKGGTGICGAAPESDGDTRKHDDWPIAGFDKSHVDCKEEGKVRGTLHDMWLGLGIAAVGLWVWDMGICENAVVPAAGALSHHDGCAE